MSFRLEAPNASGKTAGAESERPCEKITPAVQVAPSSFAAQIANPAGVVVGRVVVRSTAAAAPAAASKIAAAAPFTVASSSPSIASATAAACSAAASDDDLLASGDDDSATSDNGDCAANSAGRSPIGVVGDRPRTAHSPARLPSRAAKFVPLKTFATSPPMFQRQPGRKLFSRKAWFRLFCYLQNIVFNTMFCTLNEGLRRRLYTLSI